MQKKQGISLIVLVITIIVMIILAGAIVLTLNNSGIISKAEDAVEQTNLATIRELAQMAWAEAYMDGARTEQELKAAVNEVLTENKITEDMYKGYTIEVTTSGVEFIYFDPALNHDGIIPEGATYTTGRIMDGEEWDETNAIIYVAGDTFPQTVSLGDKYLYNNYEYVYGCRYNGVYEQFGATTAGGWGARWIWENESVNTIGKVLQTINNLPITTMDFAYTFLPEGVVCVEGFEIPSTVTSLINILGEGGAYIPENFAIAEGVKNLYSMFDWTCITSVPSTFKIPKSATNLSYMFANRIQGAENNILELTSAFVIPENVEDVSYMFDSTEWGDATVIGTITIDANPTKYEGCFKGVDMSKITLAGKCSRELKQLIAETGENADQVTIID